MHSIHIFECKKDCRDLPDGLLVAAGRLANPIVDILAQLQQQLSAQLLPPERGRVDCGPIQAHFLALLGVLKKAALHRERGGAATAPRR